MNITRRPRRGRVQISIALLIGLAVAAFGVIRYFTTTQVNPVTGEKQHLSLSPDQEKQLGLQSAPHMIRQMGGEVPPSDPRAQLVRTVGQRLIRQIGPNPWNFQFHLLADSKTVNAFALPGGQCFITLALFNQLQNEAQLAGVLGHEAGHVIHRHSAQQMAKQNLGQSLVTAVAVGTSDRDSGYMGTVAAQYANQMLQLKYGRGDETESDSYGVEMMAKAGYDPREMVGVMEILKRASGGSRTPEFASSHPDPGNRANAIKEQVARLYPNGVPGHLTKGVTLRNGVPSGGTRETW
jgi:beta-barrel assembly-enhancing protease